MKALPRLTSAEIEYMDSFYRARLQALAAVDELVASIVTKVEKLGIADNTYIIFTSDNGFHMAQHRLPPGKGCAYEEDINIPFMIRGPGVPKGKTVNFVISHTDITPTLFKLANIPQRSDFDGTPIPLTASQIAKANNSPLNDHLGVEFWGVGIGEGIHWKAGAGGSFSKS